MPDTLLRLSLGLNVVVLVPVCFAFARRPSWALAVYGPAGPGRQILLAMYVAILALSIALLFRPVPTAVLTLLALQVGYKLLTPLSVGHVRHPVVVSNLAIAAVHLVVMAVVVTHSGG